MITSKKFKTFPHGEGFIIGDECTMKVVEQTYLYHVIYDDQRPIFLVGWVPYALLSQAVYVWGEATRWLKWYHFKPLREMWNSYVPSGAICNAYLARGEKEKRFAEFFGFEPAAQPHPDPAVTIYMQVKK